MLVDTPKLKRELEAAWPAHVPRWSRSTTVFAHAPLATPSRVPRDADDHVTMIYTSGTSGEPKGVLYTVANVDFMLERTIDAAARDGRRRARATTACSTTCRSASPARASSSGRSWPRANPLMVSTDLNNLVQELGTAEPHYFLNVPTLLERIKLGVGNKLKERGGLAYALYRARHRRRRARARRAAPALADKLALEHRHGAWCSPRSASRSARTSSS